MRSVLPRGSLRGLRAISTAGMGHTARQVKPNAQRQPLGEYSKSPTLGAPVCCHLKVLGSTLAEVAAARGIEAQWSLKVPADTVIPAGSVWRVTDDCGSWTETVRITGDLVKHGRVMRLVGAVDTTLDKA